MAETPTGPFAVFAKIPIPQAPDGALSGSGKVISMRTLIVMS